MEASLKDDVHCHGCLRMEYCDCMGYAYMVETGHGYDGTSTIYYGVSVYIANPCLDAYRQLCDTD